jgi:S1-C subfamily serine protease
VNPLDLVAILLVVVGALLGFRSGAIPQIGGLVGAIGGAAVVILGLPYIADQLAQVSPAIRPFAVLGGLLIAVALGESIGSTLGRRVASGLGDGVLGAADRIFGSFVGVAQAVLIVWLVGGLVAFGPVASLSEAAQTSRAIRTLNALLPAPAEFAVELGRILDSTGLPAVFVGFEPIPAPPVDRPDDPTARRLAQAAVASTVKVSAAACGYESIGTGFAIRADYVVTNAHVIAGANQRAIRVSGADGRLLDGTAVLFDPTFDIALIHVKDLDAPGLRFAAADPSRGAIGATLGYPGGGRLEVLPAAVAGAYAATGRDIYNEATVRRQILELRAAIDRGDSGGPFILQDGTVGGVVFAEARTDPDVGYALSPTEVATRVAPAIDRTSAVDTGDCIR